MRYILHSAGTIAVIVLTILAGTALNGCPGRGAGEPKVVPGEIVVAVDRSRSTAANREDQIQGLRRVVALAAADERPLSVWAYDEQALPVWPMSKPQRGTDLDETIAKYFAKNAPSSVSPAARPDVLFKTLADDIYRQRPRQPFLIIFTSGKYVDATDTTLWRTEARRISKYPGFHVVVLGLDPQYHEAWHKAFDSIPTDQYRLYGAAQIDDALNEALEF